MRGFELKLVNRKIVMPVLVTGIHAVPHLNPLACGTAWMRGSSPRATILGCIGHLPIPDRHVSLT